MRYIKKISFVLCLIAVSSLAACSNNGNLSGLSKIEMSFNTSTPSNSEKDKTIYINEDLKELIFDGTLVLDEGTVAIRVIDTSNNSEIWVDTYANIGTTKLTIELKDLKANTEYIIRLQAEDAKKVKLELTTSTKLVKDKDKTDAYSIEKPTK